MGCRKDGSCFPIEIGMSQMQIGERTFTIGCIRDISGRKAYTEALEHRTLHDELTGLPNRALFGDRMDLAIASASGSSEPRGVLLVDLDEFREVNETLGRDKADAVLTAVAERLRGTMRDSDTVARLGSDEFGILPSGATDVETAASIAWKIREAFENPFLVDGHVVDVQASIGIAFFPQHGRTTADLLRRAELAMQEAKQSGNGLAVFVSEPEDQSAHRLNLLSELRDCIPRDDLVLHFQPQVDLATRRTIGVEALVRWRHPTDGLLMPAEFMPEAERSELIEPLTSWVLDEALHQQRLWSDAGIDLTMAVNISARSLVRGSEPSRHRRAAHRDLGHRPRPAHPRAHGDRPDRRQRAGRPRPPARDGRAPGDRRLRHRPLVARLPAAAADRPAQDRSFVRHEPRLGPGRRRDRALDHRPRPQPRPGRVAEGVEDEAALDMLVDYGCDIAQGYYFSRPCPADELTAWLIESPFGAPVRSSRLDRR